MRSKNWGVILLVIVLCMVLIVFLNSRMRTTVSENMQSQSIDLKSANSQLSSVIGNIISDNDVNGSINLAVSNRNNQTPVKSTINFSIKNGVLTYGN